MTKEEQATKGRRGGRAPKPARWTDDITGQLWKYAVRAVLWILDHILIKRFL